MWEYPDLMLASMLIVMATGDDRRGDLDSGGGGVVGKNATTGRDYTGRDHSSVNVYNQFGDDEHGYPTRPQINNSDKQRLIDLERYMYGDGYSPGVLKRQMEIIKQQDELERQQQIIFFWLYFLAGVTAILIILRIINLAIIQVPI